MFNKKDLNMKKWILPAFALGSIFMAACSDSRDTVGTSEESEGITAVKDWEVAGVSQKGPFVTGSAVTVQELDGITLKQTGKSFKGSIKSDKGDFAIKDINLGSQYAILEASGYYRDEISGKKSAGMVTLRALTDLSNRKTVNINLLTHLEYERVMYLVNKKKMSIAEAKAQAEEEVLASFAIEGDFGESEDLNIFESGDGNAALLAVSVLMQGDVDVAGLTERIGEFSIALAEGGSWDDADTKTAIADWACDIDLKGSLSKVRKNVEGWKYADTVPAFEKYVTNFWWNNYGLGVCNKKRENETKRNVNKLSSLYNEYFVCENGRWHIPSDEPKSSSSAKVGSSSSGATPQSSDDETSSSASQDLHSALPSELQFLEKFCSVKGPTVYGDGEERVWTCRSWTNVIDTVTRDSAASALVDTLDKKGFVFERTMLSDSLKSFILSSFRDSLSYIYSAKKNNLVYKIAMTKTLSPAGAGYGAFMFDVAIFEMKEGFEDLPINISMSSSAASSSSFFDPFAKQSSSSGAQKKDSLPDLPDELAFVEKYLQRKTEYTEYAGGKQIVWRGESPWYSYTMTGTSSTVYSWDSAGSALVKEADENGFEYVASYSNDSLDNDYVNESHVYSKTSDGKVYTLVITKSAVNTLSFGMYSMAQFYVKMIVRDEDFDEIPTENEKDYNSPKYRDLPEDLKFIGEAFVSPSRYSRGYSNDSMMTYWIYTSIVDGYANDADSLPLAREKVEEYASMMESHGFTLKSKEDITLAELEAMGYGNDGRDGANGAEIVTLYRYEKDVEGFLYKAEIYPSIDVCGGEMIWYETHATIKITIYDK